jgi:hypothetical protein
MTNHDVAGVVERLRHADRHSVQRIHSSDIFAVAADRLESQAKALSEALALAKQLSDALLTVRPLGGSELFIKRAGDYYADPEYMKAAIKEDRDSRYNAMRKSVMSERSALAAKARLAEAIGILGFYAEPFEYIKKHGLEEGTPDFYDEMNTGERAQNFIRAFALANQDSQDV